MCIGINANTMDEWFHFFSSPFNVLYVTAILNHCNSIEHEDTRNSSQITKNSRPFLSLIITLIETKLKNPIDSQSNQKYLCVYVTEIERKVISFIQNKSENENKMEKLW